MSFLDGKATTGGGDYNLCPAGNHPGVCIGIIDLGTHWQSFQGQEERKVRRVLFVWEVEAEVDGQDKRLVIGRDYNIGLGKDGNIVYGQKSNIRKLLEGWRGKGYGDGEKIDLEVVFQKAGLVNVTHEKTQSGKDVARVNSVSSLPKGMKPIIPEHKPIIYSADSEESVPEEEWLPRVFGEKVEKVLERSMEFGGDGRRSDKDKTGNSNGNGNKEKEEDTIPF